MPSPQDGKAGTIVPPSDPVDAKPADDAEPGAVEAAKAAERQSQTGKYGTEPITPYTPPDPDKPDPPDKPKSWIGIKLIDKKGKPVPGEAYIITLGNGQSITGTTGEDGSARADDLDPGSAQVSFPNLDNSAVKPL